MIKIDGYVEQNAARAAWNQSGAALGGHHGEPEWGVRGWAPEGGGIPGGNGPVRHPIVLALDTLTNELELLEKAVVVLTERLRCVVRVEAASPVSEGRPPEGGSSELSLRLTAVTRHAERLRALLEVTTERLEV